MARAIGIGGVFFKCRDPARLGRWYAEHLGMSVNAMGGVEFSMSAVPPGAYAVWGPFSADTTYFEPSEHPFMLNLVVDDLDGALRQVTKGGATRIGDIEEHDQGRFGWFIDPEGHKIELWQPR